MLKYYMMYYVTDPFRAFTDRDTGTSMTSVSV